MKRSLHIPLWIIAFSAIALAADEYYLYTISKKAGSGATLLQSITHLYLGIGATLTAFFCTQMPSAGRLAEHIALAGLGIYVLFAPNAIAGANMGIAVATIGLLCHLVRHGRINIRRTPLDLPICLFFVWTLCSSLLSEEPRLSLSKLPSFAIVLLFYLTRSIVTRHAAIILVVMMLTSGVGGVLWGAIDLVRGRGVKIEELAPESPFHELQMGAGDAVWRVGGARVSSVLEIDEAIRRQATGERLSTSLIIRGEHKESNELIVTDEVKARPSPSGIKSSGPTHRFRASGWTRHYQTFSETLQILAQLALGLALAHLARRGSRRIIYLALAVTVLLALGIAFTAMRTLLVAFAIGALVISLRATHGRLRMILAIAISLILVVGAFTVWRTRASGALLLKDDSSSLRWQVAQVGLKRLMLHPVFGHGMDAMQNHWTEWGFPGTDIIHLHSTPLQLAFDRGLPALLIWLWIMTGCWLMAARGEKFFRDSPDANRHGLLLGATGGIIGFFASSLVNYNWGDAEVALVFWWMMGTVVVLSVREE